MNDSGGKVPPKAAKKSTAKAGGEGQQKATPSGGRPVKAGWGRYLVAPRPSALLVGPMRPLGASALFTLLDEDPDVQVITQVAQSSRIRGLGAITEPPPACPPVAVVEMSDERARTLAGNPQVLVEPDQALIYSTANPIAPAVPVADPALAVSLDEPAQVKVRVQGSDGASLSGAHVWAVGSAGPAHAVTDSAGHATLVLPADTPMTVRALYVRPASGYWPIRIDRPLLPEDGREEGIIKLRPLSDTFEGFPERSITGWGQQAMRLNQLPPTYRGHGIKIAILDAGIDTEHPDLENAVRDGHDFIADSDRAQDADPTGRGTWCAGVIAAADNHVGVAGIAVDAELYACKLFPHGRVSHLLQTLDWCIAHEIDIIQINLACPAPSQLVALKIFDARAAGVACIAPAGDNGATVAFPASLPTVLAVGAIGHTGTYPPGSLQAVHAGGQPTWAGPYPPAFTPVGPGVDLVGPGVAVITTAPSGDYIPADGTDVAAAHITGLAALLLAHHDHLRTQPHPRTPIRVDNLMALIRASCRPVVGDSVRRTGAGLPDAPVALGLAPHSSVSPTGIPL